ncbi:hypothetical protein IT774_16600 [Salinimonas marina]|uniref:Uncharacterized protein n=1 Tax=Salinimonas marina TaxID=2785918 RepID=A0A7S9DX97_9ALTE|nr:hypothetical protein [Salinimonas marina]QPG05667.1 hypothetical protein IT774_16600 [Salinimonas marina]
MKNDRLSTDLADPNNNKNKEILRDHIIYKASPLADSGTFTEEDLTIFITG